MKHLVAEFDALRARFPAGFESSMVLPCLRRIQEDRGYVADADIDALVAYLGVPRMQIEEVPQLLRPVPARSRRPLPHRGVPQRLVLAARRRAPHRPPVAQARHPPGETTADGRFSLATVECMASCGTAPVVVVNGAYHESMSAEKLDALIEAQP
jgi:NADH-quinone oxidoreductase subunit E